MRAIVLHDTIYYIIEFEPFEPYGMNFKKYQEAFNDWFINQYQDKNGNDLDYDIFPDSYEGKYPNGRGVAYWMNLVSPNAKAKFIRKGKVIYKKRKCLRKYKAVCLDLAEEEKKCPIIIYL